MVEREKSWEAIPFRVRYHLELPGEYRVVVVVDDPGLFELPPDGADLSDVSCHPILCRGSDKQE